MFLYSSFDNTLGPLDTLNIDCTAQGNVPPYQCIDSFTSLRCSEAVLSIKELPPFPGNPVLAVSATTGNPVSIANTWEDLFADGAGLNNNLDDTLRGTTGGGSEFWTGCQADGSYDAGKSCNNWQSNTSPAVAWVGRTSSTGTNFVRTYDRTCTVTNKIPMCACRAGPALGGGISSAVYVWTDKTQVFDGASPKSVNCAGWNTPSVCTGNHARVMCSPTTHVSTIPAFVGLPVFVPSSRSSVGQTVRIANDWSNMFDSTTTSRLIVSLKDVLDIGDLPDEYWSGCAGNGEFGGLAKSCNNFNSNNGADQGFVGRWGPRNKNWIQYQDRTCSASKRVLCACTGPAPAG